LLTEPDPIQVLFSRLDARDKETYYYVNPTEELTDG